MSHDHGMFVNDLFNGEALSGGHEGDRGIFRKHLFDGEPLGQTTPPTAPMPEVMLRDNGLFARNVFTSGPLGQTTSVPAASDALIAQLAQSGGSTAVATSGKTVTASTGSKSVDSSAMTSSAYSPYTDPTMSTMPVDSSSSSSWVPIALIGGAAVLTIGIVVMATRKPAAKATANRRRSRARRNRRRSRR